MPGKRGFASMDPEKARAIRSAGGKAVQASGNAHRWTSETASEASKKGLNNRWSRRPTLKQQEPK